MQSGKLDRRVTLQAPTVTKDARGGPVTQWVDQATVWAEVVPLRGREFVETAQVVAGAELKVRMRYRTGVLESWRVVHEGTAYDIQHIAEIGRRDGLELLVKKP